MTAAWTSDELDRIEDTAELLVATERPDGSWRDPVPIWAVVAAGRVYVRTWHRRETGWYGRAVRDGRARILVPGVQVVVAVADCAGDTALRDAVDAAYRRKYGGGVDRMVADEAAATTLRFDPQR